MGGSASSAKDENKSGVCLIDIPKGFASGFFGIINRNSTNIYGLFTNNHVIDINYLRSGDLVKCLIKDKIVLLSIDKYFFTCELMDVTFIKISVEQKIEIEQKGGMFLMTTASKSTVCCGDSITIIQRHQTGALSLITDIVDQFWGFDFYHKVSTEDDLSGSPVVDSSGITIGIHKGRCPKNKWNVAIHMFFVQDSILRDFERNNILSPTVISQLNASYIKELEQNGLVCLDGSVFVSPASFYVTPIWFKRTFHSWFWTPTDPQNDPNWMIISTDVDLKVIGGSWEGKEPALKNIKIIKFLQESGNKYLIDMPIPVE